ncbi:hypothetical protein [Nostoc sp. LEGE 12447]|uniref:hypothetical protein n=1 Tax=Nostoc sp. LEGE 12447 TaxID=1828640 RepID=UPI002AD4F72A|nr:hypothetical protein [Nostoc sp. LEGE 12447]
MSQVKVDAVLCVNGSVLIVFYTQGIAGSFGLSAGLLAYLESKSCTTVRKQL